MQRKLNKKVAIYIEVYIAIRQVPPSLKSSVLLAPFLHTGIYLKL